MRNKKLIIMLFGCIALLIFVLVYRNSSGADKNPEEKMVTTGQVARAVALLGATTEDCKSASSHFVKNEEWYVPYMNLMYERGYFKEKQISPSKKEATGAFTYQKLEYLYENMGISDKKLLSYVKNNRTSQAISNKTWKDIIQDMAEFFAADTVSEECVTVVATVSNVSSLAAWNVATSTGTYVYTGLSMDYYIDKSVKILTKGNEILCVMDVESSKIKYPNVLITNAENGEIHAFLHGVVRVFSIEDKTFSVTNAITDISVSDGKVRDYVVKQGYVSGKLLRYSDTSVDIDGQGTFEISDGFRVYKTYGSIEEKSLYDMVVGYDVQKFLIEDGKLCAVLIDRNLVAQNIRVVVKTTGFSDIYHKEVTVSSASEFKFAYGSEEKRFTAGEEFTIAADSPYLESGSLVISAAGLDSRIQLKSIERGYGQPSYRGTIEVMKTEQGLVVINELSLEEYLYAVVPSEMPYTYHPEALKAQAICARSYAYKQMASNAYANLGAHVDDSTAFQVYNNSEEQISTSQAVDDTCGQIMTSQGEPIRAFFYSTSCGSSADATIWGGDGYEYIKGRLLSNESVSIDFTDEAEFKTFITSDYDTFDREYGWYRWNVSMPLDNITQGVNQIIGSLYASGPEKVLTLVENEYVSREITSVGNVQSIETGKRGTGGVLEYVIVHGDEATVMVRTESYIRKLFCPYGLDIVKKDESTINTMSSLPSAFFVIEKMTEGENLTGYRFVGGGYGHGAGMSQNGANTMGSNGMGYEEILKFFYHNITIEHVY